MAVVEHMRGVTFVDVCCLGSVGFAVRLFVDCLVGMCVLFVPPMCMFVLGCSLFWWRVFFLLCMLVIFLVFLFVWMRFVCDVFCYCVFVFVVQAVFAV